MSAFWEIHEKVWKISEICGFFSWEGAGSGFGLHFGWFLGPFWEQLGAQSRKKGDPETLAKNDGKKETQDFPSNSDKGGSGP